MFKFFIFIFLENNNIGHLLKISRDYFRSPPPKKKEFVEKKWTLYLLYFVYIFENVDLLIC